MSENASNDTQNLDSSAFTRVKNHYEALRSELGNNQRSSEYTIAEYGSCGEVVPDIKTTNDQPVWSQVNYKFLENKYNVKDNNHLCVHPNLWENGASNHLSGVFEVLKGKIYQVRGYDMSNLTFVRSNPPIEGCRDIELPRWIVFDTLMSNECTDAAMKLFEEYLKETLSGYSLSGSIVGMIISHSHIDHYGGMETVAKYFVDSGNGKIDEKESKNDVKKVANRFILAPAGFYDHSVSENVYLGNAMGRRASYQYGSFIKPSDPNDVHGEISIGIGQGQSTGRPSAVGKPTIEILKNTTLILDKIKVEFQLTPGTEAPAEMNNYIPKYKALWLAENCSGTLHNLYTLRGAEIRDAKAWASYLMQTALLYGENTDVIFQSHNWPHWRSKTDEKGNVLDVDIRKFIIDTASIYKYIHDQTLLYMNMGYKMDEVADMLVLPRGIQKNWSLKPFYGTPVHNAKAVYQKYLGWYDANPIHLQELPPEQLAKEMMRYMQAGSKEKMLTMIKDDIDAGNFWTAAYMANQIILARGDDKNVKDAKDLCASALQQLGYQSESGTWRNAYLSAAYELRNGKIHSKRSSSDSTAQMPAETLLDYISIFFDGERAASKISCDMYLKVTEDVSTSYFLFVVKNGAILYHKVENADQIKAISGSATMVTLQDLRLVAAGKYTGSCGVLKQISKAMVSIDCDRFKCFDIIDKHDGEVLFEKDKNAKTDEERYEKVDLKKEVEDCIKLLEKYTDKFKKEDDVVHFSEKDIPLWNRYYNLLKVQTQVILDGDFFIPGDATMGIGNDNQFMSYELNYTLYSLYRYLYRSYLKNDYGYKFIDSDKSTEFVKLKEKIVLLETYVADFYLSKSNDEVDLEEGDALAWCYLNNDDSTTDVSFSVAYFFGQLYNLYKKFSNEIKNAK
jgi:alkyl sulfatase BDS1-like metallo-beta-lactamase superfamily hydrolase